MERHFLVRFIWTVLVLISGAYYLYTVRRAFQKYYDRLVNTVLKHEHVDEMDFPAVTICSRNMFALGKLLMTDDNPLFKSCGNCRGSRHSSMRISYALLLFARRTYKRCS